MKRDAADARFSLEIRERDRWTCQRCGTSYVPPTRALHCAHIFSRGKYRTRFDPDNAVALCYGCHRHIDTHPIEKETFFRERMGDEAYDALRLRANRTLKSVKP